METQYVELAIMRMSHYRMEEIKLVQCGSSLSV